MLEINEQEELPLSRYLVLCKKQLENSIIRNENELYIFNITIRKYPNIGEAYYYRGQAYEKYNFGSFELAELDYTRAINLGYTPNRIYESRASVRINLNKLDKACEDYSKLIETYPSCGKFYFWRGLLRIELNQTELAECDYLKCIEFDKDFREGMVYEHLCNLYRQLNQFSKAMSILNLGLRAIPNSLLLLYNVAKVDMELGNYELAYKGFKHSMDNDCEHPDYYKEMGLAKFKLCDYKSAIHFYSEAINMDDCDFETYLLRSKAWYQLRENRNAFEDCEKAKMINPKYKEAFDFYSYLTIKLSPN